VKAVPVRNNENKRTQNFYLCANSHNWLKIGLCAYACFSLGHPKFCKFGYSHPMWVWAIVESAVVWSLIGLPHMGHINSEFVLECQVISSLTISMAAGGNPPALWSICVYDGVSIYRSLAHGFGLCTWGINVGPRYSILHVRPFRPS
jgi:hypothetical protein